MKWTDEQKERAREYERVRRMDRFERQAWALYRDGRPLAHNILDDAESRRRQYIVDLIEARENERE